MKRTVVVTAFPYPLIWDRGHLEVNVEGHIFEVDFLRQYRQSGDNIPSPSFSPGYSASSNVEMPYDRLGRVGYTRVDIWFPMYVEKDKSDELQRLIHAVINRLLDVYRFTTGESYVDTVPANELWEYEVMDTNEDGTTFPASVECRRVYPMGYGVRLARTVPIPSRARQVLREGSELPIPRTLYLNAHRARMLESYRLAIVEAETAFEALIDQAVAEYYKNAGASPTTVARKLRASLTDLIQVHIPKCCGQQFAGTAEHSAWKSDLYSLRNAVVHDGAPVTAEQAEKALRAAEGALRWIEDRMPK